MTGYTNDGPMKSGINHGDPITGSHAAGVLLAALRYRRRTGEGMFIDVSQQESAVSLIGGPLLAYQMTGQEPDRRADNGRLQPRRDDGSSASAHGGWRIRYSTVGELYKYHQGSSGGPAVSYAQRTFASGAWRVIGFDLRQNRFPLCRDAFMEGGHVPGSSLRVTAVTRSTRLHR